MVGGGRSDRHAVGFSGHKNEYRSGVTVGNFAEEILAADSKGRPGYLLDKGGAFSGQTTSQAAYCAEGKSGAALAAAAQRDDITLKYVKVPVSSGAYSLGQERRRQLDAEAAANPYRTIEKDCLEAAAANPEARLAAKPALAQPKDPLGEDTQTGGKASGAFKSFYDKDYLKIGLRKQPGTQPGKQ
ncbi:flagellar associated [Micractinium conductrix]|uniref:Flagellar associated n=1 Tax=Micractinium conductrix TaxID=554055 RepID=A0A2P6VIZ8_9CHLO|nr:flagellar associated [Micractinium conductrix]|eukprot:PSC74052.1 flagellar associated [Micractinium conductrix]